MAGRIHGYHLQSIPKGEVGCISKITEECLELSDAAVQGCVKAKNSEPNG
jgi:hypothetical protein